MVTQKTMKLLYQTGEEITFKTDDLDFCGRNITFYAYIGKEENGSTTNLVGKDLIHREKRVLHS